MANFQKYIVVGRLTRDPEVKVFAGGGKVAKFGFATTNRKKVNGQWEDEPMFIDVEVYNRGEGGKSADLIERCTHKGSQVLIEGRLFLDVWDDKTTGQKRQKHKVIADAVQFLDPKPKDGEESAPARTGGGPESRKQTPPRGNDAEYPPADGGDEIPF